MNKICIKLSAFLLSAAAFLIADESTNLLTNGGFETTLTGWTLEKNDEAAEATRDTVSGDAKEGTKFLRINVESIGTENWHLQLKDPSWEATIGNIYTFSMWARSEEEDYPIQISAYGTPDDQYGWVASSDQLTLTNEWTQYTFTVIAQRAGKGMTNFAIVCGFAAGTFDIDNVVITEEENTSGSIYANGGFESGESGWTLFLNEGTDGEATMSFPEEGAKSGSKFCKISVTEKPAEDWEIQLQDGNWTAALGDYTFKFWAKAKDDGAQVLVAAQFGSTREYESITTETFTLTTEWTEYSLSFANESIEGADSISVNIYCGLDAGEYDFDDISLSLAPVSIRPFKMVSLDRQPQYTVQLLGGQLRCTANTNSVINKIAVYDVQGRIFHSINLNGKAVNSLNLPRPTSGTWIVKINSGITVENQKIVLP